MKIMITGHRPHRLCGKEQEIKEWIKEQLKEYKCTEFITGMAQGADQLGAWAALEEGVFYLCVFPFKRPLAQEQQYLVDHCAGVVWMKNKYEGPGDYIERDRFMVDRADLVLAVWDGIEDGGTWQTVKYAQEKGKPIVYFPWG